MDKKVGFIGLGIMGKPMARNLMKAGFEVSVYNRTTSKADQLVSEGAKKANSPKDLAEKNPVLIIMVADTPDVESVILGKNGVIEGIKPDSVVIDMSTISPQATQIMAGRLKEKGAFMLDAPVSGGEPGAVNATLSIMVGGEAKIFERCRHIFEALGKNITHVGPNGMGQTVKLMNQILAAGNLNVVVEALMFAQKMGVDLNKAIDAIKNGAAGSWQLSNLGPRIIQRDFKPGFMIDLMQKDLNLIMGAADATKTPLPVTSLIHQMFYSLQSAGDGKSGTQALVKALERIAGVEVGRST
ncbi:MAG: 2-hydroxy-3-oxopropionate reductase [Chloroflexota bacterium]